MSEANIIIAASDGKEILPRADAHAKYFHAFGGSWAPLSDKIECLFARRRVVLIRPYPHGHETGV